MKPPVMPLSPVAISEFTAGDCSTSITNLPVVSLQKTKRNRKFVVLFALRVEAAENQY